MLSDDAVWSAIKPVIFDDDRALDSVTRRTDGRRTQLGVVVNKNVLGGVVLGEEFVLLVYHDRLLRIDKGTFLDFDGPTRVVLDNNCGFGDFLELVVLHDNSTGKSGGSIPQNRSVRLKVSLGNSDETFFSDRISVVDIFVAI